MDRILASQPKSTIDFISKNVDKLVDFQETQKEKMFKIRTNWFRLQTAQDKKEHIDIENRKKKLFLLHRWDFIKEKRRICYEEATQLKLMKE